MTNVIGVSIFVLWSRTNILCGCITIGNKGHSSQASDYYQVSGIRCIQYQLKVLFTVPNEACRQLLTWFQPHVLVQAHEDKFR